MSFGAFSGFTFAAGLAVLAAALFLLSRLRVRHREVLVPTTMFWREAVEETRARVFLQRFRHPLAYLLALLIAALVWLALAQPRGARDAARQYVIVVDASAGMARAGRFAAALAAARARAAALPRDAASIVLAGARVDLVLDRDEPLAVFDRRVEGRAPDACPASLGRALFDLFAVRPPEGGLSIEVCGDAAVDPALAVLAPANIDVRRLAFENGTNAANAGVVTLGVSEAISGAWDRVDVLVEIDGDAASRATTKLDGAPIEPTERDERTVGTEVRVRSVFRDVPARGGRIDVSLSGTDALALDDAASCVLPKRPPLRVAVSPTVPAALAEALRADSGVVLADGDADVVIRRAGEAFGGAAPALELVDDANASAFTVRRAAAGDPETVVREAFLALGLAEIDAASLADEADRPIELVLETADQPSISIQSALLDERFDFVQSRAFPLFVARSVRWLANVEPFASTWAAGELVGDGSMRMTANDGRVLDAVGAPLRLPRAGSVTTASGRSAIVSLLDAAATRAPAQDALEPPADDGASRTFDLVTLAAIAALVLLALEWWLVRSERIP